MSTKFATVYCDECKREFSVDPATIQEATIELDGQALTLVYFACPKCNKIYRVILKDKRYEELREDLERTKKRIRKNHGSGNEEFARRLNDMVFKKLERLRNHSASLNAKYPGTFTFVASENNHKEKSIKYLP
jgi:RNase P subunit RPR2